MTRLMETLESRQLYSVSLTSLAAPTIDDSAPTAPTIDDSAPTQVVMPKPTGVSNPVLLKACCTGTHFSEAKITL